MLTVTAAIVLHGDRILAAQRSAAMDNPLKWEFPGGKLEAGETPEECIQRELREELDIGVEILETLPPVLYPKDEPKLELLPFLVRLSEGRPKPVEHAKVEWLPMYDLWVMNWSEADIEIVEWCIANKRRIWSHA